MKTMELLKKAKIESFRDTCCDLTSAVGHQCVKPLLKIGLPGVEPFEHSRLDRDFRVQQST